MNKTSSLLTRSALGVLVATTLFAVAPAADAKGTDVRTSGSCSGRSDWKLKAKNDDGGKIEVEFEVDSNKVGQTWKVALKDNGTTFWSGARTTVAPSGSFTVAKRTANRAGTDQLVGRATNAATGEICRAALNFAG